MASCCLLQHPRSRWLECLHSLQKGNWNQFAKTNISHAAVSWATRRLARRQPNAFTSNSTTHGTRGAPLERRVNCNVLSKVVARKMEQWHDVRNVSAQSVESAWRVFAACAYMYSVRNIVNVYLYEEITNKIVSRFYLLSLSDLFTNGISTMHPLRQLTSSALLVVFAIFFLRDHQLYSKFQNMTSS